MSKFASLLRHPLTIYLVSNGVNVAVMYAAPQDLHGPWIAFAFVAGYFINRASFRGSR